MVWDAQTEAGYEIRSVGEGRRQPEDFDGLKLVSFHADNEPDAARPPPTEADGPGGR
jgi:hypothetical protein